MPDNNNAAQKAAEEIWTLVMEKPTKFEIPLLQSIISAAIASATAELQAIVDKLPKTADGAPISPGMMVWVTDRADEFEQAEEVLVTGVTNYNAAGCNGDGDESFHSADADCHPDCDKNTPAKLAYSTREAALAAAAKEKP